jgi:hypothetical protein
MWGGHLVHSNSTLSLHVQMQCRCEIEGGKAQDGKSTWGWRYGADMQHCCVFALTVVFLLRCYRSCADALLQPLLDVLLFTRSLSRVMGYKGQIALYLYYIGVANMLRAIAPPMAAMTAQESALVGAFRCAGTCFGGGGPIQSDVLAQA